VSPGESLFRLVVGPRPAVCLFALAAFASGCAGAAERSIIGQFFSASRLLDKTALGTVSDVVFDPRTQGVVTDFRVQRISARRDGAKEITVAAAVRRPGGDTVQKTLVITMQRARVDRWIVTGFRDGRD
jgi:hypothetical protein